MSDSHYISQQINQLSLITQRICVNHTLPERGYVNFQVSVQGDLQAALLIRFEQQVYAYLNRCLYSSKRLDSEEATVFDPSGEFLFSTAHGICYDPKTGDGLSPICLGQRLTPLRVVEEGDGIYLKDKQASLASDVLLKLAVDKDDSSALFIQDEYSHISNTDIACLVSLDLFCLCEF